MQYLFVQLSTAASRPHCSAYSGETGVTARKIHANSRFLPVDLKMN